MTVKIEILYDIRDDRSWTSECLVIRPPNRQRQPDYSRDENPCIPLSYSRRISIYILQAILGQYSNMGTAPTLCLVITKFLKRSHRLTVFRSITRKRSSRPSLRETEIGGYRSRKVYSYSWMAIWPFTFRLIRACKANGDTDKIRLIIEQLCQEFAFGPSRQNASALGGLIGLAAVAIALSNVSSPLDETYRIGCRCLSGRYHTTCIGVFLRSGFSVTILCIGVNV